MQDTTTLICLFHHEDLAHAALKDLMDAGIPATSVSMIDSDGPREENSGASLDSLGVPQRDQQHLMEGVKNGGVIVAVSAMTAHEDTVESIFKKHSADKIDEADRELTTPASQLDYSRSQTIADSYGTTIPVAAVGTQLADDTTATDMSRESSELGDVRTLRMYRTVVVVPADEVVDLDNETRRDL